MMERKYTWNQYKLDTVLADCDPIVMGSTPFGAIYIPTGSPITTLTYHACPNDGNEPPVEGYTDTYLPAYDSSGTAVTQTVVAPGTYPLPTAMAGKGTIKIVSNADGTVYVGTSG